jgi:hypothetical protein
MLDIGKKLDRMNLANTSRVHEATSKCCKDGSCAKHKKNEQLDEAKKITKRDLKQLIKEALQEEFATYKNK